MPIELAQSDHKATKEITPVLGVEQAWLVLLTPTPAEASLAGVFLCHLGYPPLLEQSIRAFGAGVQVWAVPEADRV